MSKVPKEREIEGRANDIFHVTQRSLMFNCFVNECSEGETEVIDRSNRQSSVPSALNVSLGSNCTTLHAIPTVLLAHIVNTSSYFLSSVAESKKVFGVARNR